MRTINRDKLAALSPLQKEEYLARLEQLAKFKRENPLYFYNHPKVGSIKPHHKQMVFHSLYQYRTRALFGGNQSGKTHCGIADDLIQLLDADVLPDHLKGFKKWTPPTFIRIFTPDLGPTMIGVQEKMKELVPESQLLGGSWDRAYDKINRITRFNNGSWVMWNSYDQDQQKLGTITLHRIHYDEEPTSIVYEESQPRLTRYNGDQLITMTPLQGMTWAYTDIWRKSGGEDNTDQYVFENPTENMASVVVDMADNATLSEEAMENTLRGYSQEVRKARKEGRFIHFAGLIYNEFNESVHVRRNTPEKPFENRNVNIVVGIDPGIRYACSVLWLACDTSDTFEVFEELYARNWTIKEICERIKQVNAYHGVKPIYYVIDPHAKDRSHQTGRSDQSEFQKYDINPILGQNDVEAGINAVKERLRDNKLVIHGACRNLINEFRMYRWKEPPRSQEEVRPVPIKQDDHALDALRYAIMSRPYLPKEQVKDTRSDLQRLMDDDKQRTFAATGKSRSEFGGIFY